MLQDGGVGVLVVKVAEVLVHYHMSVLESTWFELVFLHSVEEVSTFGGALGKGIFSQDTLILDVGSGDNIGSVHRKILEQLIAVALLHPVTILVLQSLLIIVDVQLLLMHDPVLFRHVPLEVLPIVQNMLLVGLCSHGRVHSSYGPFNFLIVLMWNLDHFVGETKY